MDFDAARPDLVKQIRQQMAEIDRRMNSLGMANEAIPISELGFLGYLVRIAHDYTMAIPDDECATVQFE